jgi:glyoxylase-like metal-dependent hydrolase (beta-lactamase superfamily II)
MNNIKTLDLNFLGTKQSIASYLIPWEDRAILIECGPTTVIDQLERGLKDFGYSFPDVSDLFVTHIHLDHAGAAGWLARNGTRVHVHPLGAPHLINPEALLRSANRIYGEEMDRLWGEVIPAPDELVVAVKDKQIVELGPHTIQAFSTPGHASHHHVYVYRGVCFAGDVGGVRIPGSKNLTLPMPPPEFHLDLWRDSVKYLKSLPIEAIAPTHFGIYTDVSWQLERIGMFLDEIDYWLSSTLAGEVTLEDIRDRYVAWFRDTGEAHGLTGDQVNLVNIINPTFMSADGLYRYWKKYRQASK